MANFTYFEDQEFFKKLLNIENQEIDIEFDNFFDFRDPKDKRREFNQIRNKILENLISKYGVKCMLKLACCNLNSGIAVDHLIPLSTNKLNKKIRNLKPEDGKKVQTQSFGSNHIDNLIISCKNCNNHKKHIILDSNKIREIIREKKYTDN